MICWISENSVGKTFLDPSVVVILMAARSVRAVGMIPCLRVQDESRKALCLMYHGIDTKWDIDFQNSECFSLHRANF